MTQPSHGNASLLGRTFGGYEVYGLIGRGAVGTVYVGRDVRLKRQVALKVLLGSLARDPNVVKTFHREAQAAAPLHHPNIVRIYTAGIEEGTPYIAMEYVEGEPLDRFLRRKGRIKWRSALYIAQQVAEALDCAHARGVIHRDVKPANIMLDRDGRVCLTDFGIANIQAEDAASPAEGGFVGTPHYMSPEQCAGNTLTPSSDLYSLGVTLHQMIAGCLPFEAASPMALIKRITNDEPPRLSKIIPGVPDDVSRLAAYLIQKRPQDRPADARTVCKLITRIQSQNGGGSALPEALSSFIREQAQPVSVNVVAPTPFRERIRQTRQKNSGPSWSKTLRTLRPFCLAGLAAMLVFGLALGATYFQETPVDRVSGPAPTLTSGTFTNSSPDTTLAALAAPGFVVTSLAWAGDRSAVLVQLEGRPGTQAQGATGILAVDPQAGVVLSARAPVGPGLDPTYWQAPPVVTALNTIPRLPEDSPLYDAMVTFAYAPDAHSGTQIVQAVAQKWNEAGPSGPVLYESPKDAVTRSPRRPWDEPALAGAAVSPNGRTICLLLNDTESGANYLAEHTIRWHDPARLGPRLTGPGGMIDPRSIQYAPDSSAIAYLRDAGTTAQNLWVVPSGGTDINGACLTHGERCVSAAFSPSGNRLAVAVDREDGGDPEIRLIEAGSGLVEARLGRGLLSKEAWHCSGRYIVVAAREPGHELSTDAPRQIWAIETRPPYHRTELTALPEGVSSAAALSQDGQYVTAATMNDKAPALVFVNLRKRTTRLFN